MAHESTPGPNLAALTHELTAAGWKVRFVSTADGRGRWPLEARKGRVRLEVPRGYEGRYAVVLYCASADGAAEWGGVLTPDTPLPVLLAAANAAADDKNPGSR